MFQEFNLLLDYREYSNQIRFTVNSDSPSEPSFSSSNIAVPLVLKKLLEEHWDLIYGQLSSDLSADRVTSSSPAAGDGYITALQKKLEKSLENLVSCFRVWIQGNQFREIENYILEHSNNPDRLIWLDSRDAWLLRLPWHSWEALQTRGRRLEVGICPSNVASIKVSRTTQLTEEVSILSVFGDKSGINLVIDQHAISNLPNSNPEFLKQPEPERFYSAFRRGNWKIMTFSGHSAINDQQGSLQINASHSLSESDIEHIIDEALREGLQLVILNSCQSHKLAQSFVARGLPWAIAMREKVPDFIAQKFIRVFLEKFSQGLPIVDAFSSARSALKDKSANEALYIPGMDGLPILIKHPNAKDLTWQNLWHSQKVDKSREENVLELGQSLPEQRHNRSKFPAHISLLVLTVLTLFGAIYRHYSPRFAQVLNQVGIYKDHSRNTESALSIYAISKLIDASSPVYLYNSAISYEKMGRLDLALSDFKLSCVRNFVPSCSELIWRLADSGDYREAWINVGICFEIVNSILDLEYPEEDRSLCLKSRGLLLFDSGDYIRASKDLEESLKLSAGMVTSHCLLAKIYSSGSNLENIDSAKYHWKKFKRFLDEERAIHDFYPLRWKSCHSDYEAFQERL